MFDPWEVVNGRRNREHGLEVVGGEASMFYTADPNEADNGTPWHGLGTRLESPATAAEAIEKMKAGWAVRVVELRTDGDEFGGLAVPMGRAIVREDTREVLGCVGPGYKPVQNAEAFGFLDTVAAERRIEYHTGGVLGRGERIWILAKMPGVIPIGQSDDTVEKYLLLSNSHDGGSALRVLWSPQRVVCRNTLAIALADGDRRGDGIAIRHTGEIATKVAEAQRVLGLAERFFDALPARFDALAACKPGERVIRGYYEALYPDPEEAAERPRAKKNAEERREKLLGLFEGGIGHDMPGIKGSVWAAYNAVTEFVDHHREYQGSAKSELGAARRLETVWWGDGARQKRAAWDLALELVAN